MPCFIHPDKVVEDDCRECPACYLERLMTEPLPKRRNTVPIPTYACCGEVILFRPSDHHQCKEVTK